MALCVHRVGVRPRLTHALFRLVPPQIVAIKSPTLAVIFRVSQLAIALYLIVGVVVLKKGYQSFEPVTGTTLIKTKGSAYNAGGLPWMNMTTQPTPDDPTRPIDYTQIYDSTDLIVPPMERDATFITTNLWFQNNQTRATCYPGSDDWWTIQIDSGVDADAVCGSTCKRGTVVNEADTRTGGVWTGGYTLKPDPASTRTNCYCELYTWCPDENILKEAGPFAFRLTGIDQWTVSFRQNVEFRAFHTVTTNLQPKTSTVPPIYTIDQMLTGAGLTYEQVRARGAVLVMATEWNCNLDFSIDSCTPEVSFVNLGQSFNFRRVEYTSSDGVAGDRQLIKHYGIRIIVVLSGSAGKFDAAAIFTTLGAGIGLLAVASLVADFAAVNLLGKRALYEKAIFHEVKVEGGRVLRLENDVELEVPPRSTNGTPAPAIMTAGPRSDDTLADEHMESWGTRRPD